MRNRYFTSFLHSSYLVLFVSSLCKYIDKSIGFLSIPLQLLRICCHTRIRTSSCEYDIRITIIYACLMITICSSTSTLLKQPTQFVCLAVCFLEYVKNIEIRGLCCKIVLEKGCDNLRYLHKKFKIK